MPRQKKNEGAAYNPQPRPGEQQGPRKHSAAELGISRLEISYGEESFSPVRYYTFRVPPMTATVDLKPDEVVEDRIEAVYAMLERQAANHFERKLEQHLARVERCRE